MDTIQPLLETRLYRLKWLVCWYLCIVNDFNSTKLWLYEYVSGRIPSGLPEFDIPKFSVTHENGTTTGFFQMVSNIGSGVIVLPIIALIETISICKTFGQWTLFFIRELTVKCTTANTFVQIVYKMQVLDDPFKTRLIES